MPRVFTALFTSLALAALVCVSPASAQQKQEAKIGFALSMTGAAAVYGAVQKNGATLAIEEINADPASPVKITPIFEDDASTPQQGVNVYNKFINADKVSVIIGPTLSNTAQVTNRLAQEARVPVLAISNTARGITDIGDCIFRDSLTEAVVIPNTIKIAKDKLGVKKVALFYGNDDAFTKGGYDAFKKALGDAGIQIMAELTFAKGDRDFSPQLTQIKAMKPDAIVVSALAEEAAGIVAQARQLGVPKDIRIIGGNGFNSPSFIKNAGDAAEGVIVGAAWNIASTHPLNKKFVENYEKKFGAKPDQFAAQAYAGVYIVKEAMARAGSATDREKIREAMKGVRNLDTVLGACSFTENRDIDHTPVVQEVQGGKFVVFGG